MFALLPFLAPLLTKLPSLATLKWIAGGILVVVIGLTGFALGYHWEESAFEAYKTRSATHELSLQKQYDQIGSELQARYEADQVASEAETQRQLQELRNAPVPSRVSGRHRSVPLRHRDVGGPDDASRVIGVLRSAAGK